MVVRAPREFFIQTAYELGSVNKISNLRPLFNPTVSDPTVFDPTLSDPIIELTNEE